MNIINRKVLTLDEFTIQQLRQFPQATGELSGLLRDIGLAAKRINVEVNKAGLVDILGDAGEINVQGEDVKKLDVFANNQLTGVLHHGISCAGIASEEIDDYVAFDDDVSKNSKYVCLYDPMDGSGNIDACKQHQHCIAGNADEQYCCREKRVIKIYNRMKSIKSEFALEIKMKKRDEIISIFLIILAITIIYFEHRANETDSDFRREEGHRAGQDRANAAQPAEKIADLTLP